MTKRRAIYGTAATSISLARCTPEAQLLFDRLITHADDQGRMQGDPLLVKAACMPLIDKATTKSVDRWLGELADNRMIVRYESGGQALIQIVKWWEHQDWMRHIYASRWSAPDGWEKDCTKGNGAKESADNLPPDDGNLPANGRQTSAEVRQVAPLSGVVSESVSGGESEIEAGESRDAREASTPQPPLDISLHKITTTHRNLFGKDPNAKALKMYGDVLRNQAHGDVDVLLRAMYWCYDADTTEYGFVARVKARLKVAA